MAGFPTAPETIPLIGRHHLMFDARFSQIWDDDSSKTRFAIFGDY